MRSPDPRPDRPPSRRSPPPIPAPAPATLPVLALLALSLSGCATLVLGPGESGPSLDSGVVGTLVNLRPQAAGYGPDTGLSTTASIDMAQSYDVVIDGIDMADVRGRGVHVVGLGGAPAGEVARRAESGYVASRLAERVVHARGRLHLERAGADFLLVPWIRTTGGATTFREYRLYGYPVYTHDEDHRKADVSAVLYDVRRRELTLLASDRTWRIRVNSWFLGFIPLEWFLDF